MSLSMAATSAMAQKPEQESEAFTGRVGIGAMVIHSGNNLNPSGSDKTIDDLDSAADKETSFLPLIVPSLAYNTKSVPGLKFYFDTTPPIDEVGGFAFNIGSSHRVEGMGIFDASLYFTPFVEAYENPYETGVTRKSTDTSKYGVKLAWNRIMGSNFRVNAIFMRDDVDEDIIGQTTPDLERDGNLYAFNVNYSFYPSEALEIRPRLGIRIGDYTGESNSFLKYKADLEARYRLEKWMFNARVFYSYSEYDKIHPIFEKTRDENGYGASLLTNYFAPFGYRKWSTQLLLSYSRGDNNIDFYDTEGMTVGAFATYSF